MAFVDEITFRIKAGNGGDGVERWLHEKFRDKGGPAGGNGGKGGDVYLRAVRNALLFEKYAHKTEFLAENGEAGRSQSQYGKNGEDLIIDVPIGTIATNVTKDIRYELLEEGMIQMILKGGNGGLGNEHFKSAENQTPTETTKGRMGEEAIFFLELELIADAGLIGFPNAGKSSLINVITNAKSKVGAYQFTTLEPHLGVMYEYVIADIPGLIEGASDGKGLGYKFLKHIRRTRLLVHCISLTDDALLDRYQTIRTELGAFDPDLLKRPEIIVLTKSDEVTPEEIANARLLFKDHPSVQILSVLDDGIVKQFKDFLSLELSNLKK